MKTKGGATILAAAFLTALVIPGTVLAGGGGGGRGGGGAGQNNFQTRGMEQFRTQDRDRSQAGSGTGSAVSATGGKTKKGNAYGPGDGTGHIAEGETPPKDGTGYGAPANR